MVYLLKMVLEENLWEMFCFKLSDPKHQVLWFENIFGEPYRLMP